MALIHLRFIQTNLKMLTSLIIIQEISKALKLVVYRNIISTQWVWMILYMNHVTIFIEHCKRFFTWTQWKFITNRREKIQSQWKNWLWFFPLYFYNLTMHLHISSARFVNLNTSNNIGDTKGCCNAQSFDLTKGF